MSEDEKYDVPEASKGDVAHAIARSGLGAIPYAGATATELLNAVITPPLERRRQAWMEKVGNGLRELEDKMGVVLEQLQENETFIDAALEASQLAIRNSEVEKINALRNAVLNSALPNPPEKSLQDMFFSFIDMFSVWHLKLLTLFQNPPAWLESNGKNMGNTYMGAMSHLIEEAYPELNGRRDLYDQIWKDLYLRGLVSTEGIHTTMTSSGIVAKRTTNIGDAFLSFIKNPIKNNN